MRKERERKERKMIYRAITRDVVFRQKNRLSMLPERSVIGDYRGDYRRAFEEKPRYKQILNSDDAPLIVSLIILRYRRCQRRESLSVSFRVSRVVSL